MSKELQQWEYEMIPFDSMNAPPLKMLKEMGAKGWELTAIKSASSITDWYFFKRPKTQPQ